MGRTIAEQARMAWNLHILETEREALEQHSSLARDAVKQVLRLSDAHIAEIVGAYAFLGDSRRAGQLVVRLNEGEPFLVQRVASTSNERPRVVVFAVDDEVEPAVVLGPPITDELSYGRTLEEGVPESEWDEPWPLDGYVVSVR